jgi:hypothetical protein
MDVKLLAFFLLFLNISYSASNLIDTVQLEIFQENHKERLQQIHRNREQQNNALVVQREFALENVHKTIESAIRENVDRISDVWRQFVEEMAKVQKNSDIDVINLMRTRAFLENKAQDDTAATPEAPTTSEQQWKPYVSTLGVNHIPSNAVVRTKLDYFCCCIFRERNFSPFAGRRH